MVAFPGKLVMLPLPLSFSCYQGLKWRGMTSLEGKHYVMQAGIGRSKRCSIWERRGGGLMPYTAGSLSTWVMVK